jgi:hypothetical protein
MLRRRSRQISVRVGHLSQIRGWVSEIFPWRDPAKETSPARLEPLQQPEARRRLEIAEAQQAEPYAEREIHKIEHMGH